MSRSAATPPQAAGDLAGDQCLGRDQARRHGRRSASPASEMGQGTLTGLAQLVAEELECDWSKVTTEYPTPGQNVARNRVWGDFSTGGSRGIRDSHEYVRKGGAAARNMLIQAAAERLEACRPPNAGSRRASSRTRASGRTTTFGKVAAAAAKLEPPKDVQLKDPEGLDDRRQAAEAARHRRQAQRQADLRHRPQAARHAQRRDQGTARSSAASVKSFDAAKSRGHAGRQEGRAGRRRRGRRRRRHLVAGQDRARRAADRLGRGRRTPRSRARPSPPC